MVLYVYNYIYQHCVYIHVGPNYVYITNAQVSFEKHVSVGVGEEEEEEEEVVKVVKKTLFQRSNSYPQKKVLTFNRYSNDFPFSVYYSHLGFLSEEERMYVCVCVRVCACVRVHDFNVWMKICSHVELCSICIYMNLWYQYQGCVAVLH